MSFFCFVDAELIRPRWWIAQHNIVAGKHLPMNVEELQVHGSALVTSIDDCPEIAGGEGSVVTATFKTREVHSIVRAEILGPDLSIEIIEGTQVHPIFSLDRKDWVPLSELQEGERLQAADGIATVVSIAIVNTNVPVYNIEVFGEHVYQVGDIGLVVHNAAPDCIAWVNRNASKIGGEPLLLVPNRGQKYIGSLPGYGQALQHALLLKGGKLHDSVYEKGIDFGTWVGKYAEASGMTVKELMDWVKMVPMPPGYK